MMWTIIGTYPVVPPDSFTIIRDKVSMLERHDSFSQILREKSVLGHLNDDNLQSKCP